MINNHKCYLTLEARALVEELKTIGIDEDLAITMVEQSGPEEAVFDLEQDPEPLVICG